MRNIFNISMRVTLLLGISRVPFGDLAAMLIIRMNVGLSNAFSGFEARLDKLSID
jgi:hypothetical protein